jgi:DNA-binding transcriptional LysR family regulator
MRYDLTSLRVFTTVAEELNLTRASQRLHLAVSAVSKRITELEDMVGSPLLVRLARGVALTPAGQSLLHHSRLILDATDAMTEELAGFASGVKGHIRIYANTSTLAQHLPGELEAFLRQYPLVKVDIEERVGSAIVEAVASGLADFGIFGAHTPSRGLETLPYHRDRLAVAVPSGHPLSRRKSLRLADLLQHEFIAPHSSSSLFVLLKEAATRLHASEIRFRLQVSSFDALCRLIEANMGIGVLPKEIVNTYAKVMRIEPVELREPWAVHELFLGARRFDGLPAVTRALVDHLTTTAKRQG